MASAILRWLIPGIVAIGGGTALAIAMTGAGMTTDLSARASEALVASGNSWAHISLEGRTVVLTGAADSPRSIDEAVALVAEVRGVSSVETDVSLAETVHPYPFEAVLLDGKITLSGGYPDEISHQAILAEVPDANDELRLLSGGPDAASFLSAADFGLSALHKMDEGSIRLADLSLSISGRAASSPSFDALTTIEQSLPAGLELAELTITPPLVDPYVWTATFDGKTVGLSGNAPNAEFAQRLAAASPSIPVSGNLVLASGEMEGFEDKALALLKTLLLLEAGEASISGSTITLSGAPPSAEVASQVTAAVAGLGGTVDLQPPLVGTFTLTATNSGGIIVLTGHVPDAVTRDRLAATANVNASAVELGRGAPDGFDSAIDFGLAQLAHLSEGSITITGSRLSFSGRSTTPGDLKALESAISSSVPAGFTVAASDVRPPLAEPFIWSATKAAGGKITFAGYVPSEAVRATLAGAAAVLASDSAALADGAPADFEKSATDGLAVLVLLDSGKLDFDGSKWSITGEVDTAKKGFAASAAYSIAGLRTAGWSYDVRQPSLPLIAPYEWRAQKSSTGQIAFTGFVPDADFKSFMTGKAGVGATDATALGAGAPDNFAGGAAAGLEALMALDSGVLALSGESWTLSGNVSTSASRGVIQDTLSAKINPTQWLITIQANDSAPVVSPYLWAAEKQADGSVDLSGYVSGKALRSSAEQHAGRVGRNTIELAAGEPAGFADDVIAGLDALKHLSTGRAGFDGSQWSLTGVAATPEDGEAAIAELGRATRGGADWVRVIDGLVPPAPAEISSSSSEASSSADSSVDRAIVPDTSSSSLEEPASSEQQSSSAAPSLQLSSNEPSSSEPSVEQPTAPSSSEPPPPPEPPFMPAALAFEVSKVRGEAIVLRGSIPNEAARAYIAGIAQNALAEGLSVSTGLPADFLNNAFAAVDFVNDAADGRAGFDGTKWWIEARYESEAARETILGRIGALPKSSAWSSSIRLFPVIDICREKLTAVAARNALTFKSGSATLTDASLPVLDEIAGDLAMCPDALVHVEGHTDADGTEDANLILSVMRAEAVVNGLIDRGVDVGRLYAEGYGESVPVASNETTAGKKQNRRIGFSLSEAN